jgi:murein L,D-transpeptidase YcbB/YkuD
MHKGLKVLLLLLLLGFVVVFPYCRKAPGTFHELKAEQFNFDEVKEQIKSVLEQVPGNAFILYRDTLLRFYTNREFEPVWLNHFSEPGFKQKIAALYDTLFTEGLLPEWYHRDTIFDIMDLGRTGTGEQLYHRLAFVEVLLSSTLVEMQHDKLLGRVKPCAEYDKCDLVRKDTQKVDFLKVLHPDNFLKEFNAQRITDSNYVRLKQYLSNWLPGYRTDTVGGDIPIPVRKLKLKDTGQEVRQLTARLLALDLMPDSLVRLSGNRYSKEAFKAVQVFQDRSGLVPDGVVGGDTWKLLYAGAKYKYRQIAVNMERLRWSVLPDTAPYVRVNIPEFRAWLYYGDSVGSMKVCDGKPRPADYEAKLAHYAKTGKFLDKPLDPQTPMIESAITTIVLNPTWSVPANIVSREMLTSIRKDPGYLPRHGYRVYSGTTELNPYRINWYKVQPGKIPYRIVQDPGDDNSLGLIKFLFPNKYSVYMHDTPQKSKFKQNNRAVSHGCVRLEDPMRFAAFLLQFQKKPAYDDLRIWMGYAPLDSLRRVQWDSTSNKAHYRKKETYNIYLQKRVPVFMVYQTAKVDASGNFQTCFDIYGLDEKLWKLMDQKQLTHRNLPPV